MLSNIKKRIMIRAVKIRLNGGEELSEIMDSYPKLNEEDKKEIVTEVTNQLI